jgi:hypothetical protein
LGGQKIGSIAEIFRLSVDLKAIREATSLGALPAVGATSPEDFTGQTLTRVGDTEGSVDKNLQGKARGFCGGWKLSKFTEGELTGKNGKGDALATGKGDPFGRGEGHLG